MVIPALVRANADALVFICYSLIGAIYDRGGKEPAEMLAVGMMQKSQVMH
jgi:hypothetical protein